MYAIRSYYVCPCTRERVLDALVTLGPEELFDMAREGKPASVRCEFCCTEYAVSREELSFLAEEAAETR